MDKGKNPSRWTIFISIHITINIPKGERDSNTVMVREFNTSLKWIDYPHTKSTRKHWP